MTEPLVVRRETQIAPPPATVFAFLTDPEKILNWMGRPLQRDDGGGALCRRWGALSAASGNNRLRRSAVGAALLDLPRESGELF
jgi:hypothetical protein